MYACIIDYKISVWIPRLCKCMENCAHIAFSDFKKVETNSELLYEISIYFMRNASACTYSINLFSKIKASCIFIEGCSSGYISLEKKKIRIEVLHVSC